MTMPATDPGALSMPDGGGLAVGLQLVLGRVASSTERMVQRLDEAAARRQQLPVAVPVTGSGFVPNPAAPILINLGGPQQGRQWTIRRWAVADGAAVTNAIAGTPVADLYVGKPYGPTATTGAVQQWAGHLTALPNVGLFSNEQVPVYASDQVFIVVSGATTVGQQLIASIFILDEPVASFTSTIEV